MTSDSTRSLKRLLLLAGFALLIFGAKLWFIDRAAGSVPFWDQWDAEGDVTLRPWLEGKPILAPILAPHNEHRPILTKLVTLGLCAANGQWDPLLETTVNAVIDTLIALLLVAFAGYWLRGWRHVVFGGLVVLLFTLPFSWENSLYGFQSQFYFLVLFSLGHLWLTLRADRFSWSWAGGQLCGALALGSMASGLLSSAAVLAVLGHRILRERRLGTQPAVSAALALAYLAIGLATRTHVAGHEWLKAKSIGQILEAILQLLSWPGTAWHPWSLVLAAPLFWFAVKRVWTRATPPMEAVRLGLTVWFFLQVFAIAYARGGGGALSPRYLDLLSFGLALGAIAIAYDLPDRLQRPALILWTAAVVFGLGQASRQSWQGHVESSDVRNAALETSLRDYLRTNDPEVLRSKRPYDEIPYPDANALIDRLRHGVIREILPATVRLPLALTTSDAPRAVPPEIATNEFSILWSSWSPADANAVPSKWQSARQSGQGLPILRIRIAGDLGKPGRALRLFMKTDTETIEIVPDRVPGLRWKTMNLRRPQSGWWLETVDEDASGWFAVTEPVELGSWSYAAGKLLKHHAIVIGLGLACVAAGSLATLGRHRKRPQASEPPTQRTIASGR